jgi:BirA family biotin operon repressor/biotin-[acetyl-CoA-carboxylase] ligase
MTLDLPAVRRQLGDAYTLEYAPEMPSTNDRALALARDGAPAGTLFVTDFQSAGRGRRGAIWTAPVGSSVLCSVLLRPAAPLPPAHLAILTGVGIANGVRACALPVKIKWPNDFLFAARMVAVILIDTTGDAVVVGFGINCTVPEQEFPAEIRARAGSLHALSGKTISREELLTSVVRGLCEAVARVEAGGIIKVLREWNSMNWLARRKVRVSGPMGVVEGDGLFLEGRKLIFHVFKDYGVVPMPLSSTVEAR